jgi:hypothetical protein
MIEALRIKECDNGHFFVGAIRECPVCGISVIARTIPYMAGDCVACGVLCPGYAYGCTSPSPIIPDDFVPATESHVEHRHL